MLYDLFIIQFYEKPSFMKRACQLLAPNCTFLRDGVSSMTCPENNSLIDGALVS